MDFDPWPRCCNFAHENSAERHHRRQSESRWDVRHVQRGQGSESPLSGHLCIFGNTRFLLKSAYLHIKKQHAQILEFWLNGVVQNHLKS